MKHLTSTFCKNKDIIIAKKIKIIKLIHFKSENEITCYQKLWNTLKYDDAFGLDSKLLYQWLWHHEHFFGHWYGLPHLRARSSEAWSTIQVIELKGYSIEFVPLCAVDITVLNIFF